MKSLLAAVFFVILASGCFITDVFAQKVRFRSQLTPNCSGTGTKFADIYADGNIVVQGSYSCRGAYIYDISDPDHPVLAGHYNPGNNRQFLEAIVVGNRAYFGSGNATSTGSAPGVHIVDITDPANPILLGVVNSSSGNGHNTIHEMMVFEQNGGIYLIENSNTTSNKVLKIINVTNPAVPVFVRDIVPTEPQWVHAMHIRGNRMFTSGWGNTNNRGKTEIYDISNIATQAPVLLGAITDAAPSVTNGNQMHSSWTSEDGNYLYSAREVTNSNGPSPGDIRVYDIHDPAVPLLIKRISMLDLDINAVTPHNPVVMGDKLYVSWYQAGIQVFDISDPTDPVKLGEYDTYEPAFAPEEIERSMDDEPWDIICGRDSLGGLPTSYAGLWAVYPFSGEDRIVLGDMHKGLIIVDVSKSAVPLANRVSDFDGDGRTDLSTFRPSTGDWFMEYSSNGEWVQPNFGVDGDIIVTGDYDGDGKADPAIYRPSTGTWWVLGSTQGWMSAPFGIATDIPVAGDYDGDGRTDFAVFRPSNGVWYILQSSLGLRISQWGTSGDKPLTGDFDGDGKNDLTVWRPSNGTWYTYRSTTDQPKIDPFGMAGDKPLVMDYDGDGRSDLAVFRPSTGIWYVSNSVTGEFTGVQWGTEGDMPIPADFDGDGRSDFAVFRPTNNMWYRLDSSTGNFVSMEFGVTGDIPSPSSVQPN